MTEKGRLWSPSIVPATPGATEGGLKLALATYTLLDDHRGPLSAAYSAVDAIALELWGRLRLRSQCDFTTKSLYHGLYLVRHGAATGTLQRRNSTVANNQTTMAEHRRPSCAALVGSARSTAAASIRRRSSALQRMGLAPTKQRRTAGEAASTEPFEHYKFDGEESSMHLEWRARQSKGHQRMIRTVQECLVWLLGVGLGLLVGSMTIASRVNPAPCPPCPA